MTNAANKEISKGESLGEQNISIKRPAVSIQPEFFNELVHGFLKTNLPE